jgi:Mg-chelatase subunit ChlD
VAVSKVKGGGRTALGPALAMAMGIISMHDQGSRVIVATDSIPNFGMLSIGDGDQVYAKIGQCLEENNSTLSILKWSGDESKSKD